MHIHPLNLKPLEKILEYTFQDINLLTVALTHSSFINESLNAPKPGLLYYNERLEFLGDAILELVISHELYTRFPQEKEGSLTHARSQLVNEKALYALGKTIHIEKYILLGKGEEQQGGRKRPAIIADAFEALLAAIYLDAEKNSLYPSPLAPVQHFIHKVYEKTWPEQISTKVTKDYKTLLQEVTQSLFKAVPKYSLVTSEGPEHLKNFIVQIELPNKTNLVEKGSSIKHAEQNAAKTALALLQKQDKKKEKK